MCFNVLLFITVVVVVPFYVEKYRVVVVYYEMDAAIPSG